MCGLQKLHLSAIYLAKNDIVYTHMNRWHVLSLFQVHVRGVWRLPVPFLYQHAFFMHMAYLFCCDIRAQGEVMVS